MTVANVAVPDSLELALSPRWLTGALGQRIGDITVRAVTPGLHRLGTAVDDHDALLVSRRQ